MACSTSHARASTPAPLPPFAYEREPGAASRPAPKGWRRRRPEATALHRVVSGHLETLLDDARRRGDAGIGYPRFVEHEFRRYLDCGLLPHGFSRVRCPACGFERIVAFSCKGRLCPSCQARRTGDIAADLVDRVLPDVQYRQWVLTFPWPMRFKLGVDSAFLSEMLSAFLRTVFAWQRLRARRLGIRTGEAGSVTFCQRFGGILNLNPHFHTLVPDGVFVPDPTGGLATFVPLPPPTDEDITQLATRLATRLTRIARRRMQDDNEWPDADRVHVHAAAAEALRPTGAGLDDDPERKPLCARVDGYSLHAARTVATGDRRGLEQLCRYGLRAPFSLDRLSLTEDGNVRYRLHRPWPGPGGRTEIVLEPLAFLKRLAALIPAPYANLVRYHGIFANRSAMRPLLPPPPPRWHPGEPCPRAQVPAPDAPAAAATLPPPVSHQRPRRQSWASLLRRVLDIDALTCPRCATPMVVLAFISDPAVICRILKHLRIPTDPPAVATARCPDDFEDPWLDFVPDCDEPADVEPDQRLDLRHRPSRAPP
jgi:hypothetical protein